jgi:hypothetical protein
MEVSMVEVTYGKTEIGQIIYDFGFVKLSDAWLARKHHMTLKQVRELRPRIMKNLKSTKRKKRR